MQKITDFHSFGLSETMLKALHAKGYQSPTPIQAQIIPLVLSDSHDLVGQAQTGTGKTAAFGIPLIEMLEERSTALQALILVPTRELALQVADELNSLKAHKKLEIMAIYGGQSMGDQLRRLKKGVNIVVGTVGRVMDHMRRKTIQLQNLRYIVLDEADEMLNMGFIEDVERILKQSPKNKRVLLFSATMPPRILSIAKTYMRDHNVVSVKKETHSAPLTEQRFVEIKDSHKLDALCRIMDVEKNFYGLIFCRTKVETDSLSHKLVERGYAAEAIHGDVSQRQREKILQKFKSENITILVATDVAARGIDVNNLTHVINYSLPQDPETYVHRIGRTGRAGKKGIAITLVTPNEKRKFSFIQKNAHGPIQPYKLPRPEDIAHLRLDRFRDELLAKLHSKNGVSEEAKKTATDLLKNHDPRVVVSMLLDILLKK